MAPYIHFYAEEMLKAYGDTDEWRDKHVVLFYRLISKRIYTYKVKSNLQLIHFLVFLYSNHYIHCVQGMI